MDDLDSIRERKLEEMIERQQEQTQKEKINAQIQQMDALVKNYLTKDALERYGNIKVAYPEKAMQLMAILGQLIQQGHLKDKLTDAQLKDILKQITEKRDIKITRK